MTQRDKNVQYSEDAPAEDRLRPDGQPQPVEPDTQAERPAGADAGRHGRPADDTDPGHS